MNGVRIHRATLAGPLGKRKKKKRYSAAPSAADIRRIENQIERAEQQVIDLSLLEEARTIAAQDKMMAFSAQQFAAETEGRVFGTVAKTIPWVLGGVGALIAGAMLLPKRKKSRKRVQTSARRRRRR